MLEKEDTPSSSISSLNDVTNFLREIINAHGNTNLKTYKNSFIKSLAIIEDLALGIPICDTESRYKIEITNLKSELALKEDEVQNVKNENLNIQEELLTVKNELTRIKAEEYDKIMKLSYASATKTSTSGKTNPKPSTHDSQNHFVIVSPKDDNGLKDSNQTISMIKEKISNQKSLESGLRIKKFQPINGKKCLIKCDTSNDVDKICSILNNDEKLTIKKPTKKNPRIMVIGISKDIPKEELINYIVSQNPKIDECLKVNNDDFLKVIFDKPDRKGPSYAYKNPTPTETRCVA
ncbi:hypothetical protein BLA29_004901 [Euroglyphus maynei]|uniref:Uncharacterized protein n=1 Tax=Euroglyphus maynei TaxID=6958 RepID=A0A1Y3B6F4_EURMA|nr:hypothetical protein BLA29_004901 [Euroglyphus maynei]